MKKPNIVAVRTGFEWILGGLGLDWMNDPHLQDTPQRAAAALVNEICRGLHNEPPMLRSFEHAGDTGMIVLREIPVKSLCAHHLLPFIGTAVVGYIGAEKILGLSKLSRITSHYSRRPQVQERLTAQIADHLYSALQKGNEMEAPVGVGVVVQATHMCMALRGVNHSGEMTTSALRGEFREPDVKNEFFKLAYQERR